MIETPSDLAAQLRHHADRIEQLAGQRPCRLFRPHAGWRSGSMYEGLIQIDHRLVGWSWGLWDGTGTDRVRQTGWPGGLPAASRRATSS